MAQNWNRTFGNLEFDDGLTAGSVLTTELLAIEGVDTGLEDVGAHEPVGVSCPLGSAVLWDRQGKQRFTEIVPWNTDLGRINISAVSPTLLRFLEGARGDGFDELVRPCSGNGQSRAFRGLLRNWGAHQAMTCRSWQVKLTGSIPNRVQVGLLVVKSNGDLVSTDVGGLAMKRLGDVAKEVNEEFHGISMLSGVEGGVHQAGSLE